MRKYLLGLSIIAAISAALVAQGCAKNTVAHRGKSTAIAPVIVKAAVPTANPNNQTALNVALVAKGYIAETSTSPDNYASMLAEDGGCQMAGNFSDAIGANDLLASVTAYCAAPPQHGGTLNCARATTDAQSILTYMQNINLLCDANSDQNPYSFGDASAAANLLNASQAFRTDLGLLPLE